jgi:hypothetical protein
MRRCCLGPSVPRAAGLLARSNTRSSSSLPTTTVLLRAHAYVHRHVHRRARTRVRVRARAAAPPRRALCEARVLLTYSLELDFLDLCVRVYERVRARASARMCACKRVRVTFSTLPGIWKREGGLRAAAPADGSAQKAKGAAFVAIKQPPVRARARARALVCERVCARARVTIG